MSIYNMQSVYPIKNASQLSYFFNCLLNLLIERQTHLYCTKFSLKMLTNVTAFLSEENRV